MKDFYEAPEVVTSDMEAELIFVPPEGSPFWKKLLIYCTVWIVIIALSCALLWSVIGQYEKSLPNTAMDKYILSSRQDMFFHAISSLYDAIDNKYESAYDSASILSKNFNGELTYIATDEYTDDMPVYIIRHNGENLFKVKLERDAETGFAGFKNYAVTEVELVKSDFINLKSYKLIFAANMLININNTSLDTNLDGFERIDIFGRSDYYGIVLSGFVTEPEIVAVVYKYANSPDKISSPRRLNDYFIFERDGEEMYTLTISVPANAEVKIDNKTVSKFFETKHFTDGGKEMVTYTVPTVFAAKTITATLDGVPLELEQNGMWFTAK